MVAFKANNYLGVRISEIGEADEECWHNCSGIKQAFTGIALPIPALRSYNVAYFNSLRTASEASIEGWMVIIESNPEISKTSCTCSCMAQVLKRNWPDL